MTQSVHTVIVGASAAGLSTACCLSKAGIDFALLEREGQVGTPWRNHYERLHLHTTKGLSTLPHHPWNKSIERYPPRAEVVTYLEKYAERFDLRPRFGHAVEHIERTDDGWRTQTSEGEFLSKKVVVATGNARVPHTPTWPGQESFTGELLHSSRYKNGDAWKGKRVLVVGFGNSACEIALDLHERGAKPSISVRSAVNIVPRDILGVPILGIGIAMDKLPPKVADILGAPLLRVTIGDIRKLGLEPLPYGPNVQIQEHGKIPLLDIGTVELIKQGDLAVRKGIERFTESGVVFTDGRAEAFDAIVLGTGYRPAVHQFFSDADAERACGKQGVPLRSGHETLPGLYFCGFYVSPTGMLREIAIEAQRIADSIATAG